MEELKYTFTVKFTIIQYFQMLFEVLSKIVPFYVISFVITLILTITIIDELPIIGIITFFILIFIRLSGCILILYCIICIISSIFRMILTHKITYYFYEDTFTAKGYFIKKYEISYDRILKLIPLKYSNIIYVKKRGFIWFPKRIFIEYPEFESFFKRRIQRNMSHN